MTKKDDRMKEDYVPSEHEVELVLKAAERYRDMVTSYGGLTPSMQTAITLLQYIKGVTG